ncbi:MAG: replication initiator protein A [Planctomycetaceae bacterium]
MNLAEFPLSPIADRFLDGRKTVVVADQVWDKDRRQHVARELAISGSDRYGLPTARDEDVLLACVQLSSLSEFQSREVHFSRYELLKLLRWPDETKYYQRLATSLRRWKGVTVFSTRAFYDHARKSWVNRDFSIFDNLNIYERETSEGANAPASSRFVWNEVLFSNFQAGYLKKLDWDLYCRLTDPVAKRLYRLLDKRFYHGDEVTFDLDDLAFRKVRVSENYNTAQIKRALANGIRELEELWDLRPLPTERRYVKLERGRWQVVFQRRRIRMTKAAEANREAVATDLSIELTRRGIGPATAEDLVAEQPRETIQTMMELFDWYNARQQTKGPGFLVDSIRNAAKYQLPKGFESSAQRDARQQASNSRKRASRDIQQQRDARWQQEENARLEPFTAFWNGLAKTEQTEFEEAALKLTQPMKRDGYLRLREIGGLVFEQYRKVILRDHFERTLQSQSNRDHSA